MVKGIIVSTRYADLSFLKIPATEMRDVWTEVIAFEDGKAWGCFRVSRVKWFMQGLFGVPSVSVTCGPRKGFFRGLLFGEYANWNFRSNIDESSICSVKMGFGDGGYFVDKKPIDFANSAAGYFSDICDVNKPGFLYVPWQISAKKDGQELVAACFAYYFYVYDSIVGFPVSI